ncbi:hypothetical protein ACS0TY_033342 [Phlomoides rotata]
MIDHSSLTSVIISLFRASLLFVALLSTFYAHFSFNLPIFSLSSFLVVFLNIVFVVCNKMSEKMQPPQNKGLHEKILDHTSRVTVFPIGSETEFDSSSVFFDHLDGKSDDKIEFGHTSDSDNSSSTRDLSEEEDYLIEIPLEKQVDLKENEISGEDNLIEIDISMGSIRHSSVSDSGSAKLTP